MQSKVDSEVLGKQLLCGNQVFISSFFNRWEAGLLFWYTIKCVCFIQGLANDTMIIKAGDKPRKEQIRWTRSVVSVNKVIFDNFLFHCISNWE